MDDKLQKIVDDMSQGFIPNRATRIEDRGPIATEYIAFYLGEMNKKLGRIIELMESKKG
jgi:hypothetical protein